MLRIACCCVVRKTFGKPLVKHQAIRHKLMECARVIMATHGMIVALTLKRESAEVEDAELGGVNPFISQFWYSLTLD